MRCLGVLGVLSSIPPDSLYLHRENTAKYSNSSIRGPVTPEYTIPYVTANCRLDVDMSEVDCPVDGCDYSGEANSVEAHISSSTDGEHSGKAGSEFRSDLQDGSTDGKEPDEPDGDPDETVAAEDLAETAEEDDENDLAAWLLVGGVFVVLFLFGGSSSSGAPANV